MLLSAAARAGGTAESVESMMSLEDLVAPTAMSATDLWVPDSKRVSWHASATSSYRRIPSLRLLAGLRVGGLKGFGREEGTGGEGRCT